jgi:predicted ATPase
VVSMKQKRAVRPGPFLKQIELSPSAPTDGYPWNLSAVRHMNEIDFSQAVTFLVGDNGSGKSTLIEAIASSTGFNSEGGNRHFLMEQQPTISPLGKHLQMWWLARPRFGWFLRAESFYNVASFIESDEEIFRAYDRESFHERSHGESFLALAMKRFGGNGFFVLDEPEAALSFHGCLRFLTIMHDTVAEGGQFVVATHSPLLMSFPGAAIYEINNDGCTRTAFEEVESVQLWRSFFAAPGRFTRHLAGA